MLSPVDGQSPKELQNVNVPKGLPQLVERRFRRLMQLFDVGVITPLFLSSQKTSVVLAEWDPARLDFPCSLDTVLLAEHYHDLCTKTLQTLVKPVRVDPEVMTELDRHVSHPPPPVTWPAPQHMHRTCFVHVTHPRGTSGAVQHVPLRSMIPPPPPPVRRLPPKIMMITVTATPLSPCGRNWVHRLAG